MNSAGTTTGDVWHFTTESEPVSPPSAPTNPSPPNGATNQSINTELSWENGGDATYYIIYFGTNSSPNSGELRGDQYTTSYPILETLSYGTTYYWRIDSVNAGGTTTGTVWHFTTAERDSEFYVAEIGNDNNSGTSPESPFATIQHAISDVAQGSEENQVTIYIAAGTYSENIQMDDWASLEGGWNSDFTDRWDFENDGIEPTSEYETIIDGQNLDSTIIAADNTTIDGFTIINGGNESLTWGGGIRFSYGNSLQILNNNIYDNRSYNGGGGVILYHECTNVVIENNLIHNNTVDNNWGGGISCNQSSPIIKGNKIYDNTNGDNGGGISYFNGSSPQIVNNIIFGNTNTGNYGGGIYGDMLGTAFIWNNLIYNNTNQGENGGGIVCDGTYGGDDDPLIINNTIYGNNSGTNGGGICVISPSFPTIVNCIVWGNDDDLYGVTSDMISYCNIGDGDFQGTNSNISEDPLFGDDYHLQAESPCRNAGDPASSTSPDFPANDIDDEIRPQGSAYDIGADEFYDSDGDDIPDYWEYKWFGDLSHDETTHSDSDALTDLEEFQNATDPFDPDSDDDGFNDDEEVAAGTDPNDPGEYPYYDIIDPTITITSPTSSSTYSTDSSPLTIGGTSYDAVGVTQVTWSNSRGGSGTCSGTTTWSQSGITLYSGTNIITVTAYDAAGNTGTDTLTVTYTPGDTTDPNIRITSPTSISTYSIESSPLTIGGTSYDAVGVTQVTWSNSLGGSGTCSGTTTWSQSGITLYSGTNVITVTAYDAAGNTGTDTLTVTYTPEDTTNPTIRITSPTSISTYSTDSSPLTIGGTSYDAVGVTQVTWSNSLGGSGTCSGTTTWSQSGITLYSGTNVITVTAYDAAGNTRTDTLTVTYTPIRSKSMPWLFLLLETEQDE